MTTHHLGIRVNILGALRVTRPDGSVITVSEWRTGKTMDLLRLLALENGRPVRTSALIEKLWPDAPAPERARGSLRTAASQIRRTVGGNCIVRQPDGLVLEGAWVDAVEFLEDAQRAHTAARSAHHSRAVALAQAAESLYLDDFHAYDDDSTWAREERDHLMRARHDMLCEAAESAMELQHFREALDLATEAVRIDDTSELANRALMRAHAELGEIGGALRVFETYRSHLADELGADPSPQTRDLHLSLLRSEPIPPHPTRWQPAVVPQRGASEI
ncbi:MAG: AfsR/SARP family transcriptional regulator [Nocardioides sp.]